MKIPNLFRDMNVLKLRESGLTAKQISGKVGCCLGTVFNILDKYGDPKKRESWKSSPPMDMVRKEFKSAVDHIKARADKLRAEASRLDALAVSLEHV